jgi:hypothetical protein
MRSMPWGWLAGCAALACLLVLAAGRLAETTAAAPTATEEQAWPPVIDDAPGRSGYYAFARFDSDAGPFLNRDLPAVYLDKAKHQTACFSGRVDGQLTHIIVATDFGRVTAQDPATDAAWAVSGCGDALIWRQEVLTTREYWQTRLKLLPNTPDYDAEREAVARRIRTLRPWWWPWGARQ